MVFGLSDGQYLSKVGQAWSNGKQQVNGQQGRGQPRISDACVERRLGWVPGGTEHAGSAGIGCFINLMFSSHRHMFSVSVSLEFGMSESSPFWPKQV